MHKLKRSEGYYSDRTLRRIGWSLLVQAESAIPEFSRRNRGEFWKSSARQLMSARPETHTAVGSFERRDSWLDACLGHRYVPFYV